MCYKKHYLNDFVFSLVTIVIYEDQSNGMSLCSSISIKPYYYYCVHSSMGVEWIIIIGECYVFLRDFI